LSELAVLGHLAVGRALFHLEGIGELLELAAAVLRLELGARLGRDELREVLLHFLLDEVRHRDGADGEVGRRLDLVPRERGRLVLRLDACTACSS
jgi:hypothetical protein